MKQIATLCFAIITFSSISQLSNSDARYQSGTTLSNVDRYGIDYELINYTFINGDSTILSGLSLENLEYSRHDSEDVIAYDKVVHVNVLLYSRKRIAGGVNTLDSKE